MENSVLQTENARKSCATCSCFQIEHMQPAEIEGYCWAESMMTNGWPKPITTFDAPNCHGFGYEPSRHFLSTTATSDTLPDKSVHTVQDMQGKLSGEQLG